VRPGLDLGVEGVSRALGGGALSVANQLVAGANVSIADAASDQFLSGAYGRSNRLTAWKKVNAFMKYWSYFFRSMKFGETP
jgi:hypothetical protein